jgi:hypothetical protein
LETKSKELVGQIVRCDVKQAAFLSSRPNATDAEARVVPKDRMLVVCSELFLGDELDQTIEMPYLSGFVDFVDMCVLLTYYATKHKNYLETDLEAARIEYKQTRKVKGFELFDTTDGYLIWVSHYDMKYFEAA